jgi:hypothetical protein
MNLFQRIANGFHEENLYFQQIQQEEQTRVLAEQQHNENHQQLVDQAQVNHDMANHLHDQMNHQTIHDHSADTHNMGGGMGF